MRQRNDCQGNQKERVVFPVPLTTIPLTRLRRNAFRRRPRGYGGQYGGRDGGEALPVWSPGFSRWGCRIAERVESFQIHCIGARPRRLKAGLRTARRIVLMGAL